LWSGGLAFRRRSQRGLSCRQVAQNPEDLRAKVKTQTVEGKPAFFKLEAQLPKQGRTDTPPAASDKMWVVLKTYAADGENGLHAHPNEDHTFCCASG
jgi:hypothetical protein